MEDRARGAYKGVGAGKRDVWEATRPGCWARHFPDWKKQASKRRREGPKKELDQAEYW